MKSLRSIWGMIFLVFCMAVTPLPSSSAEPEVIVLQKKWRMEVYNAKLNEDQFAVERQRAGAELERRNAEIQNDKLQAQGMPTKQLPLPANKPPTNPNGITVTYTYEMKVKNTGAKEIRTLIWEYVFAEPDTKREVSRLRFESKVRIGSGKTRNVIMRSLSSPTGTIDAAKADKKAQPQYAEQVIVQRIGYADGSFWQTPSK